MSKWTLKSMVGRVQQMGWDAPDIDIVELKKGTQFAVEMLMSGIEKNNTKALK